MSVENRVVIITGATGGLGRIATRQFAQQGARLVLVGTSLNKLQIQGFFANETFLSSGECAFILSGSYAWISARSSRTEIRNES